MDENTDETAAQANTEDEKFFGVSRVYVKDLSFEAPNAPRVLEMGTQQPRVELAMNATARPLPRKRPKGDVRVEVTLKLHLHIAADEETRFLLELAQCGVFVSKGHSVTELTELLENDAPRALFPFARAFMWTVIGHAGFPPVLLRAADFDTMLAKVDVDLEQMDA